MNHERMVREMCAAITAATAGAAAALPCVTVLWLEGEQVVDYRVHLDLTPALDRSGSAG